MRSTRRSVAVGIGALLVTVALTGPARAGIGAWTFIRGDYDGNGTIDLGDGISLLDYLFIAGTPQPPCFDAADVNDDGALGLVDAIYLLYHSLAGGPPPPAPYPACGADLTFDGLGCNGPLVACPEADLPPNLVFSFADDALESDPGIRMHPNSAPVTAANFEELKFRMRPVTLQVGASSGTVQVTITGPVEIYTLAGTLLPSPASFDATTLPQTLLFNATAPGDAEVTALHTTGGLFDIATIHVSLDPGLVGHTLAGYPDFEYVRTINENDQVQTALEPNRHGERAGLSYRVYIVDHKTPAQWAIDNTLVDVSGGFETAIVNGTTIATNVVDAWTTGLDGGVAVGKGYDVVCDFGLDGTLDPGDLIDGLVYGEAGFYICKNLALPGPYATTSAIYSGGSWLGQKTYWPTNIATLGEVPLVVMSHGNGHDYTWYDYLGTHLASYGYVFMSHQNQTGPGIETASTTTLTNTDYFLGNLATIAGGVLDGHVDSTRICWIGHSRGGEGVARAYDRIFDGVWSPVQYTIDDIQLVSSIAPTVFLGVASANPHDVNYHLLGGAADGDVDGSASCSLCQFLRIHQAGTGNTLATYVQGAGHNDFNCCGFADATGPSLIGRPAAQIVAKSYYIAMIEYFTQGNVAGKDYLVRNFDGFHPSGIGFNVIVANQWKDPAGTAHVIDDFQSQSSTTVASTGETITWDVNNVSENKLNDINSSFSWTTSDPMNGMTQASDFIDNSRGVVFDWNLGETKFWEYTIAAGERDFRDNEFITLRAAQTSHHPNTVGTLNFSVTLRDTAGVSSTINFGEYGDITRTYLRSGGWANEFGIIRLRITDFENGGNGIDLGNIEAVRLEFGGVFGSDRGHIGIDDVQLSND